MICAIFMICILLLSVKFVMYFNRRNKDIYSFIIFKVLYGKHVELTKKGDILASYTTNTLYSSDVNNLDQEFDNSVQIVKINGHA